MNLQTIIASGITGILTLVISYFLFRRKLNVEIAKMIAETHKSIADANKSDIDVKKGKIELVLSESELLEHEREMIHKTHEAELALEEEREAHRLDNHWNYREVKRLKEELQDFSERFYKLAIAVDTIKQSEQNCRTELAEVKVSIASMQTEQHQATTKLKSYSDRAAQLTALVKKAHKNGFLSDADIDKIKE